MKKSPSIRTKPLALRSETIRQLANDDMKLAAGGDFTSTTHLQSVVEKCLTTPVV